MVAGVRRHEANLPFMTAIRLTSGTEPGLMAHSGAPLPCYSGDVVVTCRSDTSWAQDATKRPAVS